MSLRRALQIRRGTGSDEAGCPGDRARALSRRPWESGKEAARRVRHIANRRQTEQATRLAAVSIERPGAVTCCIGQGSDCSDRDSS